MDDRGLPDSYYLGVLANPQKNSLNSVRDAKEILRLRKKLFELRQKIRNQRNVIYGRTNQSDSR